MMPPSFSDMFAALPPIRVRRRRPADDNEQQPDAPRAIIMNPGPFAPDDAEPVTPADNVFAIPFAAPEGPGTPEMPAPRRRLSFD
jgi:hypothetical protein